MSEVKKLWKIRGRGLTITASELKGSGEFTPYPLARNTWLRAIKLTKKHGTCKALQLIDERAWRAFNRGDDDTSRRWRDLIIAIHAMEQEELVPGENAQ